MRLLTNKSFSPLVALSTIAFAGVLLAGCTSQSQPTSSGSGSSSGTGATDQTDAGMVKAEDKVGDTTLSGTLTKAGQGYALTVPGKPPKELDSYKVELGDYVGKQVTVTGQYSGNTLFVREIK